MQFLRIKYFLHPTIYFGRFMWHWYHKNGKWNHLVETNKVKALKLDWLYVFESKLKLDNPQTLNEKIQWLMAYSDTTLWSKYTDKHEIRAYVEQCGYKDTLLQEYGVWNRVEDIDFDALPNSFAIKCTHDCGSTLIIKDKKRHFDKDFVTKHLQEHLGQLHGYRACELHYNRITPRIIAEQLLPQSTDDDSEQVSSTIDYKFWCIEGKAQLVLVCYNRVIDQDAVKEVYTLDPWESRKDYLSEKLQKQNFVAVPKPQNLDRMVEMAEKLATGFHQVRVDLYNVNGKVYFGELTFTAATGKMTSLSDKVQLMLGQKIKLPPRKE